MTIETKRLCLMPLKAEQLVQWADDMDGLARSVVAEFCNKPDDQLVHALQKRAKAICDAPENWLWHTIWLILHKEDRKVVGHLGFMGEPDDDGVIEFVFALGTAFERRGYMTEAVRALCRWAKLKPNVYRIKATVDSKNIKAQRVLHNGGFIQDDSSEDDVWVFEARS